MADATLMAVFDLGEQLVQRLLQASLPRSASVHVPPTCTSERGGRLFIRGELGPERERKSFGPKEKALRPPITVAVCSAALGIVSHFFFRLGEDDASNTARALSTGT